MSDLDLQSARRAASAGDLDALARWRREAFRLGQPVGFAVGDRIDVFTNPEVFAHKEGRFDVAAASAERLVFRGIDKSVPFSLYRNFTSFADGSPPAAPPSCAAEFLCGLGKDDGYRLAEPCGNPATFREPCEQDRVAALLYKALVDCFHAESDEKRKGRLYPSWPVEGTKQHGQVCPPGLHLTSFDPRVDCPVCECDAHKCWRRLKMDAWMTIPMVTVSRDRAALVVSTPDQDYFEKLYGLFMESSQAHRLYPSVPMVWRVEKKP